MLSCLISGQGRDAYIHDSGHDDKDGMVVSCNQTQPCCDAVKEKEDFSGRCFLKSCQ